MPLIVVPGCSCTAFTTIISMSDSSTLRSASGETQRRTTECSSECKKNFVEAALLLRTGKRQPDLTSSLVKAMRGL